MYTLSPSEGPDESIFNFIQSPLAVMCYVISIHKAVQTSIDWFWMLMFESIFQKKASLAVLWIPDFGAVLKDFHLSRFVSKS